MSTTLVNLPIFIVGVDRVQSISAVVHGSTSAKRLIPDPLHWCAPAWSDGPGIRIRKRHTFRSPNASRYVTSGGAVFTQRCRVSRPGGSAVYMIKWGQPIDAGRRCKQKTWHVQAARSSEECSLE